MASMTRPTIDIQRHIRYFLYCLRTLPTPYTSLDTNRLTVAYFCVSGLDLLGALDKVERPGVNPLDLLAAAAAAGGRAGRRVARRLPRRLPLWRAILWREWPSDNLRLRHRPHWR